MKIDTKRLNRVYGYGKIILCQQARSEADCKIAEEWSMAIVNITKTKIEQVVSSCETCAKCPCNLGEVELYWKPHRHALEEEREIIKAAYGDGEWEAEF